MPERKSELLPAWMVRYMVFHRLAAAILGLILIGINLYITSKIGSAFLPYLIGVGILLALGIRASRGTNLPGRRKTLLTAWSIANLSALLIFSFGLIPLSIFGIYLAGFAYILPDLILRKS